MKDNKAINDEVSEFFIYFLKKLPSKEEFEKIKFGSDLGFLGFNRTLLEKELELKKLGKNTKDIPEEETKKYLETTEKLYKLFKKYDKEQSEIEKLRKIPGELLRLFNNFVTVIECEYREPYLKNEGLKKDYNKLLEEIQKYLKSLDNEK